MLRKIIFTVLLACLSSSYANDQKMQNLSDDIVLPQSNNVLYSADSVIPINPVIGHKKVLLVVGKWNDGSTTDPSVQREQVFSDAPDSLRSYILAASKGKLVLDELKTITPDLGQRPSGSCGSTNMLERARDAASQEGIKPDEYDYLFVAVKCQGGAVGEMPGNYVVLYGQGGSSHVWIHEFGHNLGINHPDTYINCPVSGDVVKAPEKCGTQFVGDSGDPVGGGRALYPGITRAFAGWLDDSQYGEITRSGVYKLGVLLIRNS